MKKALIINALFSFLSGIILILLSKPISSLFELESTPFWIIGIALIFFSATILLEIKKKRRLPILWIITQDCLWVVGSVVILILQPFGISNAGNYIIAVIACVVLGMAINQYLALKK